MVALLVSSHVNSASYVTSLGNHSAYLLGSLWGLNEMIHVKQVTECLTYSKILIKCEWLL